MPGWPLWVQRMMQSPQEMRWENIFWREKIPKGSPSRSTGLPQTGWRCGLAILSNDPLGGADTASAEEFRDGDAVLGGGGDSGGLDEHVPVLIRHADLPGGSFASAGATRFAGGSHSFRISVNTEFRQISRNVFDPN